MTQNKKIFLIFAKKILYIVENFKISSELRKKITRVLMLPSESECQVPDSPMRRQRQVCSAFL